MADQIKYNYSVQQLDDLIEKIDKGILPMMTPDLEAEVNLRRKELQHMVDDDGEWDDDYQDEIEKHKSVMTKIEEERRKARSRNVLELELSDEELAEIHEGCAVMYVRNDPNASYNISEETLAANAEEAMIKKRLESLGKVYYHQEDYRNAMNIIRDAIEYSLKHHYPWMSYKEALEAFRRGDIKYKFGDIPTLFVGFDKQITDPKILAGIVTGDVKLIDEDEAKPKKKRKRSTEGVSMPTDVISRAEYDHYVKMHNAGWNTPISLMLKASSTMYNRYVMPPSASWFGGDKQPPNFTINWDQPGAAEAYYDIVKGIKRNPVNDVIAAFQAANNNGLNQVLGQSMRDFPALLSGTTKEPEKFVLSTSLEESKEAAAIEQNILNLIRQNNPNL